MWTSLTSLIPEDDLMAHFPDSHFLLVVLQLHTLSSRTSWPLLLALTLSTPASWSWLCGCLRCPCAKSLGLLSPGVGHMWLSLILPDGIGWDC